MVCIKALRHKMHTFCVKNQNGRNPKALPFVPDYCRPGLIPAAGETRELS